MGRSRRQRRGQRRGQRRSQRRSQRRGQRRSQRRGQRRGQRRSQRRSSQRRSSQRRSSQRRSSQRRSSQRRGQRRERGRVAATPASQRRGVVSLGGGRGRSWAHVDASVAASWQRMLLSTPFRAGDPMLPTERGETPRFCQGEFFKFVTFLKFHNGVFKNVFKETIRKHTHIQSKMCENIFENFKTFFAKYCCLKNDSILEIVLENNL